MDSDQVTSIQDVRKVGLRDLMTLLKMPPPNGHSTWIHGVPVGATFPLHQLQCWKHVRFIHLGSGVF